MSNAAHEPQVYPTADLFPLMSVEELRSLAADIRVNGLEHPILLYQGRILDGRNRMMACHIAGVVPQFADAVLNGSTPTQFVIEQNLSRRHLSQAQRSAIAVELIPFLQQEIADRDWTLANHGRSKTEGETEAKRLPSGYGDIRELTGKAMGVSPSSVQRFTVLKRNTPELFARLLKGEFETVKQALKQAGCELRGHPAEEPEVRSSPRITAAKSKMIGILSHVRGLCRGLSELDVKLAAAGLTAKELHTWHTMSLEIAGELRTFARNLKDAK